MSAQPRILMCPPDHYGIEYEINPWMNRSLGAVRELSFTQWKNLHAALVAAGVQVETMTPQPGLPDLAAALPVHVGVGVAGQAEKRGAVGADREPELRVEGRVERCERFGVGLVECVLEPRAVTGGEPATVHVVID